MQSSAPCWLLRASQYPKCMHLPNFPLRSFSTCGCSGVKELLWSSKRENAAHAISLVYHIILSSAPVTVSVVGPYLFILILFFSYFFLSFLDMSDTKSHFRLVPRTYNRCWDGMKTQPRGRRAGHSAFLV